MTPVMQEEDFNAAFDHIFGVVEEVITGGGVAHPVVLGLKMAQDHSIESLRVLDVTDLLEGAGSRGKDLLAQAMFKLVELPTVDIVAHVSEAWYLVKPTTDQIDPATTIATAPDRKEGVMFLLMSKDSEVLSVSPIHREPTPSLERGSLDFTQNLEGRFAREPKLTH